MIDSIKGIHDFLPNQYLNINYKLLKKLIKSRYFVKGEDYVKQGMIQIDYTSGKCMKAKAVGNDVYDVELFLEKGNLGGECSCEAYYRFGPCKHMAAVGIIAIEYSDRKYKPSQECIKKLEIFTDFEGLLNTKKKEELIEVILGVANRFPKVRYLVGERCLSMKMDVSS